MVRIFLLITVLFNCAVLTAKDINESVQEVFDLLSTDYGKATEKAKEVLQESTEKADPYGIVKCNFTLGFIEQSNGNYGKSILYYLEAVRHAEPDSYNNVSYDIINLNKNIGNLLQEYNLHELSLQYYKKGADEASRSGNIKEFVNVSYNSAKSLSRAGRKEDAIKVLEQCLERKDLISKRVIAQILNRIGAIHESAENFELAISNYQKLLDFVEFDEEINTQYSVIAFHNLGSAHFKKAEYDKAIENFLKALPIRREIDNKTKLFLTLRDLGESYAEAGRFKSSLDYLNEAKLTFEEFKLPLTESNITIYKLLGNTYRGLKDTSLSLAFHEKYYSTLETYLEKQKKVEEIDKQYNLELITERYYTLVAQQERNDQIKFFSIMGISAFLAIVAMIVGYNAYSKYRVRRDLERSISMIKEGY
ncbi:MAG: tetratricopeptide repeat protein [Cyclobacteriaceae bacterium]|nr:tetratricopeptide repeat protein [Cyclobacteriaceae bacterium HetDA_MAG_MS6]